MLSRVYEGVPVTPNLQGRESPSARVSSAPVVFLSLRDPRRRALRAEKLASFGDRRNAETLEIRSAVGEARRTACCTLIAQLTARPRARPLAAAPELLFKHSRSTHRTTRWRVGQPWRNGEMNSCRTHCEAFASSHRDAPPWSVHVSVQSARKQRLLSFQKRSRCEVQFPKRQAHVFVPPCACRLRGWSC